MCLVLRGLLDRLIEREMIGPSDVLAIRSFAVDFGGDIGSFIPSDHPDLYPKIKEEVLTLWESLGIPRALPNETRLSARVAGT